MDDDDKIKKSPLFQSVTRDGKTVHINIYEDGEAGWILQVMGDHGNSTTWTKSFETDKMAFDEAISAIENEGLEALIGRGVGWPDQYIVTTRVDDH